MVHCARTDSTPWHRLHLASSASASIQGCLPRASLSRWYRTAIRSISVWAAKWRTTKLVLRQQWPGRIQPGESVRDGSTAAGTSWLYVSSSVLSHGRELTLVTLIDSGYRPDASSGQPETAYAPPTSPPPAASNSTSYYAPPSGPPPTHK